MEETIDEWPKALIFDLDGTLLYTLEDIADAANSALRQEELPPIALEEFKLLVGGGVEVLIERMSKLLDVSLDKGLFVKRFKKHYIEGCTKKTQAYPGLMEVLHGLARSKSTLAILSNKPDALTKRIAQSLLSEIPWFRIYGASDDFPPKPDPALLLHLISEMGLRPSDCAYIGDSGSDMQVAKAAGTKAWGVCWGYREIEELRKGGADRIVENPSLLLSKP